MTDASIDFSELRVFAADLTHAADDVAMKAPGVIAKGAVNIKAQLREEMGRSKSFGKLAPSIGYDLTDDGLEAQIGPKKRAGAGPTKAGTGANIAYFGGANGGGGTVPDPQGALEAESPRFEAALAALVDEAGL